MSRPRVTCARCGNDRKHHGRGLCSPCWHYLHRTGGVEAYGVARPNRVAQIAELADSGMTRQEIADHLGMTLNAVAIVHRRSMGANVSVWEKLYVSPPPDEVACARGDAAPWMFDLDVSPHANIMQRRNGDVYPSAEVRDQIAVALSFCARCPLATREWCLDTTRPAKSRATMVAGGVVWSEGRALWSVEQQDERDERLAAATAEAVAS